ncbi:hypothetical protein Ocin01_14007, partial [Orchesella cincta]
DISSVDYLAGGDSIEAHYLKPPDEPAVKAIEVCDGVSLTPMLPFQNTENDIVNVEDSQASLENLEASDSIESHLNTSKELADSTGTSNEVGTEAQKYKLDDSFLEFCQGFTTYCEDKRSLVFNTDMLIEEGYFPLCFLNEYVPINVVCLKATDFTLQLPERNGHCAFASCTDGFYDYFAGQKAAMNLEMILRDHVMFVFNSLHCKKLTTFSLECTTLGEQTPDTNCSLDRMLTWNHSISKFISRHRKNLKRIEIKVVRSKNLSANDSSHLLQNLESKYTTSSFPKLVELTVIFWDTKNAENNGHKNENENESSTSWTPDWFPDAVDHYWLTLLQSQLHGRLRKLLWISAANLNWNDVFQPVIDANENTLEILHIQDIRRRNADSDSTGDEENAITACFAFKNLDKLKNLYLRKANCYLVDLEKLPSNLEELCIDDIALESKEIIRLESLRKLKVLRLMDNILPTTMKSHLPPSEFGVDKSVLLVLLHCRRLQELCIWGHRVFANVSEIAENTDLTNTISVALANINAYLKNVFSNSEGILSKLATTTDFNEPGQDHIKMKRLMKTIQKFGFMDESCIVIHADR